MGINLDDIFGQAKAAAAQGMSDVLKTGGNAALGYLEGSAVSVLQADQKQHQEEAQKAVSDVLNRPSSPFGTYLQQVMQQPIIKQYGVYILGGIAIIVVATIALRR